MGAVGQHIPAGEQPGVVIKAEQVQEGGQDVLGTAVVLHHKGLLQPAGPAQKAAAVLPEGVLLHRVSRQGLIVLLRQAVGEVVGGEHHHRALGEPRLLQPFHQIFHGLFQLQLAGPVCPQLLGTLDIRHQVLILGADVVVGKGVVGVAGIGHVVGVEGLLRYVVIHCFFHHLQVGGGIARLHVQAAVDGGKIVAHVGVGVDPVVEGADVVMVGLGLHPRLGGKEVAQTEGQIVLLRHGEAHPAQVGHQAHAQAVLPVGGQIGEAVVEVAEHDALIGHAVEGGGALGVDEVGGKGLGAHHNQVVVLKQAGVSVFGRPLEGGEILVQAAQAFVLGGLIQGVEVHAVQHVFGASPPGGEVQPGGHPHAAAAHQGLLGVQRPRRQQAQLLRPPVYGGGGAGEGGRRGARPGAHQGHGEHQHRRGGQSRRQQGQLGVHSPSGHRQPFDPPQNIKSRHGHGHHQ